MIKIAFIFLLLLVQFRAIGQSDSSYYSECAIQTKLAEQEYYMGKYKFCVNAPWNLPFMRIEDVLDSLCRKYNLTLAYYPDPEPCRQIPYYCYTEFMDSILAIKFGKDFKANLIRRADRIFISRHLNDTIPYYHCDTEIEYAKGSEAFDSIFFANFKLSNTCRSKITPNNSDYNISFIVDKNGFATNFEVINSGAYSDICINEIQQSLLSTAKRFKHWKPATLGNKRVISKCNLFIDVLRQHIVIQ